MRVWDNAHHLARCTREEEWELRSEERAGGNSGLTPASIWRSAISERSIQRCGLTELNCAFGTTRTTSYDARATWIFLNQRRPSPISVQLNCAFGTTSTTSYDARAKRSGN